MNAQLDRTRPGNGTPPRVRDAGALPAAPTWNRTRTSGFGDHAARWGLAAVLLLFGYEWLISGLNKLLSASFRDGLGAAIREAAKGNPNRWYIHFLNAAILPHTGIAAALVEVGEVLVAAGFFAGAGLWLGGARLPAGKARMLQIGVIGALLGSALMTANYYLLAGNTWPGVSPSNPFNEGLSIDGLMTLVAVALIAVHVLAIRARPADDNASAG